MKFRCFSHFHFSATHWLFYLLRELDLNFECSIISKGKSRFTEIPTSKFFFFLSKWEFESFCGFSFIRKTAFFSKRINSTIRRISLNFHGSQLSSWCERYMLLSATYGIYEIRKRLMTLTQFKCGMFWSQQENLCRFDVNSKIKYSLEKDAKNCYQKHETQRIMKG